MRRFFIKAIILVAALASTGSAMADNTLSEVADSAYAADDYKMAVACYEQLIRDEGSSTDIYYNLGNALYRDGQLGKAVIAYERALKIDPSNDDARFNLEFVSSRLVDKQVSKKSTVDIVTDSLISLMSPNAWAWWACALFIVFLGLVATYLFSSVIILRKTGFFGGIVALIMSILSFIVAYAAASRSTAHNEGVIVAQSVIMSSAPRVPKDRSEEIALIHEGTGVNIIDSLVNRSDSVRSKWYKVELDREHQGWIIAESIEII